MLISFNWLKSYIPEIPEPKKIEDLIIFHLCEIEETTKLQNGDTVFDLKVLPDRAHDLLSHQGVAREIAGLLGEKFKLPEYKNPESNKTDLSINVESDNCRRYMGRIVKNIKVGSSPEWMVKFLESIGERSINNIVDATNIVMYDCGQPIHAFDLKQILSKKIVIKQAKNDESIQLVGSEKITAKLKDTDIVITDGENNLAIAGVKGGLNSGISDDTTDILVEVANFEPVAIRKTARRLSILTDASKRYENDLSPTLCDLGMKEISSLIFEMCPDAVFEEIIDIYPNKQEKQKISFSGKYISKMLGIHITDNDIEKILKNYNYIFSHTDDTWEVEIPDMRLDIKGTHDFVEEIGRVYGYDKIVPLIPKINFTGKDNDAWVKIYLAKQKLIIDGYKEVMTYAFCDCGEIEIMATASDKNFLRTNLTDSLKESISLNQKNLPLLETDEVKVFEVGTIFTKKEEDIHVAYGDKKNVSEISLDEFFKKVAPEYLPDIARNSFSDFSNKLKKVEENIYPQVFKQWSLYPFITRDIAVWVPEGISPEKLVEIYKSFGTELLVKEPKLFDSFTKDKKTSYAYRLVFQSYDRTLTDEEINTIMANITDKVLSLGFEVR